MLTQHPPFIKVEGTKAETQENHGPCFRQTHGVGPLECGRPHKHATPFHFFLGLLGQHFSAMALQVSWVPMLFSPPKFFPKVPRLRESSHASFCSLHQQRSLLPICFLHDSLWRQKKFFYMQQHMKNYFVLQKFQTSEEVSLVLNTTITFFFFLKQMLFLTLFLWTKLGYFFKIILPVYELLLQLSLCICILVFVFFLIQHRGAISQWPVLTMVSLLILRILLFSILFGHLIIVQQIKLLRKWPYLLVVSNYLDLTCNLTRPGCREYMLSKYEISDVRRVRTHSFL